MTTCESLYYGMILFMFVVLSNASHNTDSYNSDLAYTLCYSTPSTCII